MPIGIIFWVLWILWFISWVGTRWGGLAGPYLAASEFLLLALLFFLGWGVFGFVVHG